MRKHHEVSDLHFEADLLVLTIDGEVRRFRVSDISPALENASEKEKASFEISPSGYGVHWPLLDEDLSIDGLLGIVREPALDAAYWRILQSGLIAIRDAASMGDLPRCQAEAAHIHNIPSLIGEENVHRHLYYANRERKAYLDWVNSTGREELQQFVSMAYAGQWEVIDRVLGLSDEHSERQLQSVEKS